MILSLASYRLRQLEQASRQRELTPEEQQEVVRWAQHDRRNAVRRRCYATDPRYREAALRRKGKP